VIRSTLHGAINDFAMGGDPTPFVDDIEPPAIVFTAGDPDAVVSRVAVCGGAGDSLLGAASAAGVDAYLTADRIGVQLEPFHTGQV